MAHHGGQHDLRCQIREKELSGVLAEREAEQQKNSALQNQCHGQGAQKLQGVLLPEGRDLRLTGLIIVGDAALHGSAGEFVGDAHASAFGDQNDPVGFGEAVVSEGMLHAQSFGGPRQLSEGGDAGAFGQGGRQSVAILPDGLQHGGIQRGQLVFRQIRIYRIVSLIQKIQIIQLRRRIGYVDGQFVLRTHIGLHRRTEQRAQKKQDA